MIYYYLASNPETISFLLKNGYLPETIPEYLYPKKITLFKNPTKTFLSSSANADQTFILELRVPNTILDVLIADEHGGITISPIQQDWVIAILLNSERSKKLLKNIMSKSFSESGPAGSSIITNFKSNTLLGFIDVGSSKIKVLFESLIFKFYFAVPYENREDAKKLGMNWDASEKKWFVHRKEQVPTIHWPLVNSRSISHIQGENRSFGGNQLFIDLVPNSCWFTNVRSCVHPADWDRLRKYVYARVNYTCECCGAKGNLEAHERWHYDDHKKVQKLLRLIALCHDCHAATHMGLATLKGEGEKATKHLAKVNNKSIQEVEWNIRDAFAVWEKRNKINWELDLSIITNTGLEVIYKPKASDRVEIAQRTIDNPSNESIVRKRLFDLSEESARKTLKKETSILFYKIAELAIARLCTYQEHMDMLRYFIQQAKNNILITSFTIRYAALKSSGLDLLMLQAARKGVRFYIYYNDQHQLSKKTLEFLDILQKNLKHKPKNNYSCYQQAYTHSKIVCVDDHSLIVGSFNGLSTIASQSLDGVEGSWAMQGQQCAQIKQDCWDYIRHYQNIQHGHRKAVKRFKVDPQYDVKKEYIVSPDLKIEYIPTLNAHRHFLRSAFEKAKNHIIICSPFLSSTATYASDISMDLIQVAIAKKVLILFVCSEGAEYLDQFKQFISQAKSPFVQVITFKNMHLKTIIVDDLIAEGSFNSLSATRNEKSSYHNHEQTFALSGSFTNNFFEHFFKMPLGEVVLKEINRIRQIMDTMSPVTPSTIVVNNASHPSPLLKRQEAQYEPRALLESFKPLTSVSRSTFFTLNIPTQTHLEYENSSDEESESYSEEDSYKRFNRYGFFASSDEESDECETNSEESSIYEGSDEEYDSHEKGIEYEEIIEYDSDSEESSSFIEISSEDEDSFDEESGSMGFSDDYYDDGGEISGDQDVFKKHSFGH